MSSVVHANHYEAEQPAEEDSKNDKTPIYCPPYELRNPNAGQLKALADRRILGVLKPSTLDPVQRDCVCPPPDGMQEAAPDAVLCVCGALCPRHRRPWGDTLFDCLTVSPSSCTKFVCLDCGCSYHVPCDAACLRLLRASEYTIPHAVQEMFCDRMSPSTALGWLGRLYLPTFS